jgi:hypothetical protein
MKKLIFIPACAFFLYLSPVASSPQSGGWDVATGKSHPRFGSFDTLSHKSIDNDKAITTATATKPPPTAAGAKAPPRIKNPRHRPTCDLSLTDEQVCATGEACVEDPWALNQRVINTEDMGAARLGVCTPSVGSNMCNGFAGPSRKCSNDADGWKCAKPSRCTRENIADCDWLCVRPPPSSPAGGKGFGFKA